MSEVRMLLKGAVNQELFVGGMHSTCFPFQKEIQRLDLVPDVNRGAVPRSGLPVATSGGCSYLVENASTNTPKRGSPIGVL